MSGPEPEQEQDSTAIKTPSQDFAAYCEAEFERRLNSGEDFDEQRYREAMQLVMGKLQRLEDEGEA